MGDHEAPRRGIPHTVWWGAAAVVLVHLALSAGMRTPIVQVDEGAYLGAAHYFAFGTGLLNTAATYSPGYSLLLTPVSRLLGDPLATYHGALVVNAFLHGTVVVTSFLLARRIVGPADERRAVVAAVLVALYPTFLLAGSYAMATNLMVAGTPAVLLCTAVAYERMCLRWWAVAGGAAVALAGVHPVGAVMVVVVLLAPLLGVRRATWRPTASRFAATVAGAATVGIVVDAAVDATRRSTTVARYVGARGSASGGAQSRVGYTAGQIGEALGLGNPRGLVVAAAGQTFYLVVATFGLVLVGLVVAARAAPRAVRDPGPAVGPRLSFFAGLVLVGAVAASVFVINPPANATAVSLLYGRYNDQVVGPVLLLGLLGLPAVVRTRRRFAWAVGGVAAVAVVSAAVVLVARPGARDLERFAPQDVLGVFAVANGLGRLDRFRLGTVVPVLGVVGIAGFVALALAQRLGGRRALAVVAGLAFVVPSVAAGVVIVRSSVNRAAEDVLVGAIARRTEPGTAARDCVGYLPAVEGSWWLATYQYRLPDVRFRPVVVDADGAQAPAGCRRLVLGDDRDPAVAALGLEPIASELVYEPFPITLYRMPR